MLVALTVCLGAKAGFTNRGKKITNFIRGDARFVDSLLMVVRALSFLSHHHHATARPLCQ